jgi:hypothetical protein
LNYHCCTGAKFDSLKYLNLKSRCEKIKVECPFCGSRHEVTIRRNQINTILQEFKERTDILLCAVIDNDGYMISSILDESIDKSVEKKVIALHVAIHSFAENLCEPFDYPLKIETYSFFEETDIHLKGFIMLISTITEGVSIITIIPSWLNLSLILPEFKKLVKELSKCFNINVDDIIEDYVECTIIL